MKPAARRALRQGMREAHGTQGVKLRGWPLILLVIVPWLIGLGTIVNWIFG